MILCDTNIFIHAFNNRKDTIEELNNIGFNSIVLSSITVMELYQEMGNKNELAEMKRKIKFYDVVEIDVDTSKLAIELVEQYNLSHGLLIPDAIIGATSAIHNIELFTYNLKDFKFIPNIKLYKPQTK